MRVIPYRAFTLIELLVVIGIIITIVSMIALLPSSDRGRVKANMLTLQSFFDQAKTRAVATRRMQYLALFPLGVSQVNLPVGAINCVANAIVHYDVGGIRVAEVLFENRTLFTCGAAVVEYFIIFFNDGSCRPSWNTPPNTPAITLRSTRDANVTRGMNITLGTGKIRPADQ